MGALMRACLFQFGEEILETRVIAKNVVVAVHPVAGEELKRTFTVEEFDGAARYMERPLQRLTSDIARDILMKCDCATYLTRACWSPGCAAVVELPVYS